VSKPERILEAALQVIGDKGLHEATVDEIAEKAGVAKGTVYLYFRNKDSLLAALMQMGLERFETAVRERVAAEHEPLAQLHALMEEHVTQLSNGIVFGRVLWSQAASVSLPQEFHGVILASAVRYVELMTDILQRGQDMGCMHFLDARLTARAIIGGLNQAVFDFTGSGEVQDVDHILKSITQFVLSGISKSGGNQ